MIDEKYIKDCKRQGLSDKQIKDSLLQVGYGDKEIDSYFSKEKTLSVLTIVVPIIIILIFSVLIYTSKVSNIENKNSLQKEAINMSKQIFYEDSFNPKDWISSTKQDNAVLENNAANITLISVEKATSGMSSYVAGQQKIINLDGSFDAVFFTGYYKGNSFSKAYYLTDENKTAIQNSMIMRIGNDMIPDDGILEFFAILKNDYDGLALYIFVDDDFKKLMNSDVNIVWSSNVNDDSLYHEQKFDFDESKKNGGVYYNRITDVSFLIKQRILVGNIYVGDITKNDVFSNTLENKTYINID